MSYAGQQARPEWYDRAPLPASNTYASGGGIAPHGATTRWAYTVPAARKFQIQLAQVVIDRATGAGPAALAQSRIVYTPSGGAAANVLMVEIITNSLNTRYGTLLAGSTATMLTGDTIAGVTQDASVGGTVSYFVASQGIEFSE
jgi:hypothetical protein